MGIRGVIPISLFRSQQHNSWALGEGHKVVLGVCADAELHS